MRFIRKARYRERILDILSKALLIAVSALACLWMVSGAHANPASITGIKGQADKGGSYVISLAFSQKVPKENVSVEFERNFIQVSLKGVSAYPARTEALGHAPFQKVFTYQYQPDLARARVLLKGQAASLRDKASWEVTSEGLRIHVRGVQSAAAPVSHATDSLKGKAASASPTPATAVDSEDERLVQEILDEVKPGAARAATAPGTALADSKATASLEEQPLFLPKATAGAGVESRASEGSLGRVIASLLLVIGVIGLCAAGYRRFAMGRGGTIFQRQPRVIETIASHSLGPKRSVALIKVLDQYMVVGMSGDGMSLLASLGTDVKIDRYLDQVGGPGASFNDTFESALLGTMTPAKADSAGSGSGITHKMAGGAGIRSMIKKRIEGFKPL